MIVKNRAVAINPIDWVIQVAGNVFGSGVTRFKIGDRVLTHAVGMDASRNNAAEGSFQKFTVVLERMAAPIQLAIAAGYEVFATASPRNFDYVRKLGATQAFDYNDKNVKRKLVGALARKTLAGALAVVAGSAEACVDVVHACEGKKFVSMATYPVSFKSGDRPLALCSGLPSCVPRCGLASAIG